LLYFFFGWIAIASVRDTVCAGKECNRY